MVSLITVYMASVGIARDLEGTAKPQYVFLMLFTSSGVRFSLAQFVAFFGPLIGLILGFDMINRERNEGTLSKLLSRPISRDTVVNGKFVAGVVVIAIMMTSIILVITGLGLIMLGATPGLEEVWRILVYLAISIVFIAFWLGIAALFSILFRSVATSALASLATWLFFPFFLALGTGVVASALTPEAESHPAAAVQRIKLERALSMLSPMELYSHGTATIIDPDAPDHADVASDGAPGAAVAVTIFWSAAPGAKRPDGDALSHHPDRHYGALLRDFLCGVHAAGNPLDLICCRGMPKKVR